MGKAYRGKKLGPELCNILKMHYEGKPEVQASPLEKQKRESSLWPGLWRGEDTQNIASQLDHWNNRSGGGEGRFFMEGAVGIETSGSKAPRGAGSRSKISLPRTHQYVNITVSQTKRVKKFRFECQLVCDWSHSLTLHGDYSSLGEWVCGVSKAAWEPRGCGALASRVPWLSVLPGWGK